MRILVLLSLLFSVSCQRQPYEFYFSREWTWEDLEQKRPESRALRELKDHVSLVDARILFRELSQLPNLNELKQLAAYPILEIGPYQETAVQATRGIQNTDFSGNLDGIIQAARWLAEHRQVRSPGEPTGVTNPAFHNREFPEQKIPPPNDRISVGIDLTAARSLLGLFTRTAPPDSEIRQIVDLPVYQSFLMHRGRMGLALTDTGLFQTIREAMKNDPVNQVYKWVNANSYFDFGAVHLYQTEYQRVMNDLEKNREGIEAVVADRLAGYLPPETVFSAKVFVLFGAGAGTWSAENGAAVNLEYCKDDHHQLIEMMVHETYHVCQKEVLSTAETLRHEEEDKWLKVLYQCLNEGTASYVASPWKEENPEEEEFQGKQLLEEAFQAYLQHRPARIEEIRVQGEQPAGPLGWIGSRMAWAIDTRLGRKALTDALIFGPIDFFTTYIRACKKTSDESLPKEIRFSRGLEKEISRWERKLNRPLILQRFREKYPQPIQTSLH